MPKHKIQAVTDISIDYTVETGDENIVVDATDGNITVTLPTAASTNRYEFTIKRIDDSANTVTVDGAGSETIDGELTQTLDQYDALKIVNNSTGWSII